MKIFGIVFIFSFLWVETAHAERIMGEVVDHYTQKVVDVPHTSTVCSNKQVEGDKTGDTIIGAIIGGVIGNNVTKNVDNGAAVGAVIGGMIGHDRSDAKGGTVRVCEEVTTYTRKYKEVYVNSTLTFDVDGRNYSIKFKK